MVDDHETNESAPVDSAAKRPAETRQRTAQFRRQLLAKLPQLHYTAWSAGDQFSVDEEIGGIVDLGADAVLAPLEAMVQQLG